MTASALPTVALRILIVEDEPVARAALVRLMEGQGHHVLSAADTLRGLKLLRTYRPERMLLDLMLPGQPGEHLLHAAKAVSPRTRIAIVTAVNDPERLGRLARLGAYRVMQKPVDFAVIREWLAEQ